MLQGNAFRLITMGRLTLLRPDGVEEDSLVKRRRKLAVLTLLALSPRPLTRDRLAALFWGEQDDDHARHSLADTLSHLRRILGKDAVTLRQEEIALSPTAPLAVDVREFRAALAAKDPARACTLYGGPFLDGVYVDRSADFDDWVARERERLAREFAAVAAEACAIHTRTGADDARAEIAARWLGAEPLSDDAATHLIESSAGTGSPEALARAVGEFDRLAARLKRDFELGPGPRSSAAAARLRERLALEAPPQERATESRSGTWPPEPVDLPAPPTTRRWPRWAAVAAVLLAASALWLVLHSPAVVAARPIIALAQIHPTRADPRTDWLADGLPQMIAADLSRSSAVDVVAPERVREVRARASRPEDPLAPAALADLGRRLGATWVITGALTAGDTSLVLELDVVDVARGKLQRVITVSHRDPLTLADGAAARLFDFLNATGPGPHLAAVETASLEAYQHYVAGEQATEEGHFALAAQEIDRAVALDSGFISAVTVRLAMARDAGDGATASRLQRTFERYASRASAWDRATEALDRSMHAGERERSEGLGRGLVAQFPNDPRAYALLATVYVNHGRWDAADTLLSRELSLDSLALEAGTGPCAPCVGYSGLVDVRVTRGDLPGATQAAFRWVGLQPDLPVAWDKLSTALSFDGRFPEAIEAERHAMALAGDHGDYQDRLVRSLLMARRYPEVDSALAAWRRGSVPILREAAIDIGGLYLRERGRYREAAALLERGLSTMPGLGSGATFVHANTLTRLGRPRAAAAIIGDVIGPGAGHPPDGDVARAQAWEWALKASALAEAEDTTALAAIADSIGRVAEFSYYGRDWHLPAAVRGMAALNHRDWRTAATELQQARWGIAGWTEINVALARAYLKLGQPDSAITVLRDAYAAPLDAMGRYQPRSELDYELARAFVAAGKRDSANAYVARLREAWQEADAEPRARLTELERMVR
ncbi:MAG: hypothetical protein ACHQXA_03180 [Gemmatimonadales bacterium]